MVESQGIAAECPSCHAGVSLEAMECPRCGEQFEAESPDRETAESGSRRHRPGFRERFLFYVGIALILLGGPGIALGSWLHDVLRLSFLNYNSFDVFGAANRLVVAVGLIVSIVGVVCFILSLRLSHPPEDDVEVAAAR